VIEHLTNLPLFLDWSAQALCPDGILVFTTPDMTHPINKLLGLRSPSIKIPQHVVYFTRRALDRLLKPRFEPVFHCWDWQWVSLGQLASRIRMIFGLNALSANRSPRAILVPNGMRLFVYRRTASERAGITRDG